MSAASPIRVRLARARGWRMPPNTVKVDRTTKWGNPFIVGKDGTAAECVQWHKLTMCGYLVFAGDIEAQKKHRQHVAKNHGQLRGKNLACWCALDKPCHADVLLEIANR